jgi:uncharacterized membrane protein HdeD (DUF308 family)
MMSAVDNNRVFAAAAPANALRNYYALRAVVAAAWVIAAAYSAGKGLPMLAAALLVAYPAWDALANLMDALRNGGMARNRTQLANFIVSAFTAAVILVVIGDMRDVLAAFGAWAIFAGLLQLATGMRRWRSGAQWSMVLSGAQSSLAGGFFIRQSFGDAVPSIADVAPYAAFGAFYFLVSALWLTVRGMRARAQS